MSGAAVVFHGNSGRAAQGVILQGHGASVAAGPSPLNCLNPAQNVTLIAQCGHLVIHRMVRACTQTVWVQVMGELAHRVGLFTRPAQGLGAGTGLRCCQQRVGAQRGVALQMGQHIPLRVQLEGLRERPLRTSQSLRTIQFKQCGPQPMFVLANQLIQRVVAIAAVSNQFKLMM